MAARVLVVDENLQDLETCAAFLRAAGFGVSTCDSFREGARRLEREAFDLVIVSQGATEFGGRCVLERAVQIDRSIPVVVLTPRFDAGWYAEAVQLGAVDYLEKPVCSAEFLWVLTTHLKDAASRPSLCAMIPPRP